MLTQIFRSGVAAVMVLIALMPLLATGDGIEVAAFNKVTISVAGKTQIHPSAEYRVSVKADDSALQRIKVEVDGDTLRVYCPENCGSLHHDGVEVYVPTVNAVRLLNGGHIELKSGMSAVDALVLTIHNGGTINASTVVAQQVEAEIYNGGRIVLTACKQLDARIRNGGNVQYFGPAALVKDVINGGSISNAKNSATSATCGVISDEAAR